MLIMLYLQVIILKICILIKINNIDATNHKIQYLEGDRTTSLRLI